jgi:hypothetical protein
MGYAYDRDRYRWAQLVPRQAKIYSMLLENTGKSAVFLQQR